MWGRLIFLSHVRVMREVRNYACGMDLRRQVKKSARGEDQAENTIFQTIVATHGLRYFSADVMTT
jgi:hypothetical protein